MSDLEAVAVSIGHKLWTHWDDIEITRSLDSHATAGFSAPFEPERQEFRDAFRPFSFQPLVITVDDKPLFTGTLVEVTTRVEPDSRTVQVSGYSRPAVLADCHVPAKLAPFQASGLSLRQIAQRLAGPFGVGVVMDGPEGAAFKRVNLPQAA